jgi:tetratricopeptide (TPR) repeat protein
VLTILFSLLAAAIPTVMYAEHLTNGWGLAIFTPVLFLITLALLFRRGSKGLEPIMKEVEKHLSGGRRELAVKTLEQGFALKKWNPLLPAQLHGQLGVLHYTFGELDEARDELSKAGRLPWTSPAYLGCVYFKQGDEKAMRTAFDKALSFGGKETILYTLYAYCLRKLGRTKDAIDVLEKGVKKTASKKSPPDPRLMKNLELLKEGKKMKPQIYGDKWAQFSIDGTPSQVAASLPRHMRGFAQRPGFRNGVSRRKSR